MSAITRPRTRIERFVAWVGSTPSLILHSFLFAGFFALATLGAMEWETMLLVLTTAVSLEAIYLAIFIQMTVNRNTASLLEVEEGIEEIQEDVEGLEKDVDEIQEDIEEMSEDVEEIQEDLEEISADEEAAGQVAEVPARTLEQLSADLRHILEELEGLKGGR